MQFRPTTVLGGPFGNLLYEIETSLALSPHVCTPVQMFQGQF